MSDKLQLINFGCRLNSHDSEVIRDMLTPRVGNLAGRLVVVQSCAVTKPAVEQVRRAIRKHHREHANDTIAVVGCAAQIDPNGFAAMPEVSAVLGTSEKFRHASYDPILEEMERSEHGQQKSAPIVDVGPTKDIIRAPLRQAPYFAGKTSALLQIQGGCDHKCTFCIIPQGRGHAVSLEASKVFDCARSLVAQGYNEIVFTGVDICSWGQDLDHKPQLGDLCAELLEKVPELATLRLTSLDPGNIDKRLISLLQSEKRLSPYVHFSMQSGHNMILKRMRRRHSREELREHCAAITGGRDDAVLGADVIAGFPTESIEMHRETMDLISECNISHLHVFPYSQRPGTPAARMPQIEKGVIRERAREIRQLGMDIKAERLKSEIGNRVRVIVEPKSRGRTTSYLKCNITQDDVTDGSAIDGSIADGGGRVGRIINALVKSCDNERLHVGVLEA